MAEHLFSNRNQDFKSLIDVCAQSPELTIFCGAGCSAEMGVPTWEPSLRELLLLSLQVSSARTLLSSLDITTEEAIDALLVFTRGDPARLATYCEMLAGRANHQAAIKLALYGSLADLEPGPSLRQIARIYRLRQERNLTTTLVTTNYDEGLLVALRQQGLGGQGVVLTSLEEIELVDEPFDPEKQLDDDRLAAMVDKGNDSVYPIIHHLHGLLSFKTGLSLLPVILGERGYARSGFLSADRVRKSMESSTCVFVGLSLTDVDLVAAAFQASEASKGPHFALICEDERVSPLVRIMSASRLDDLHIQTIEGLRAFAQIPQILYEIGCATDLSMERYWEDGYRYGTRLQRWWTEVLSAYDDSSPAAMHTTQDMISKVLRRELSKLMDGLYLDHTGETIGLHMWVRSHDAYTYYLWASTEYAGRQWGHRNYESRPSLDGRLALQQAFRGVPTRQMEPTPGSRWRQAVAVPVVTSEEDHPLGRLQVGVISLSTNEDHTASSLSASLAANRTRYVELVAQLEDLGRNVLCDFNLSLAT